jgi:hypothetical protein
MFRRLHFSFRLFRYLRASRAAPAYVKHAAMLLLAQQARTTYAESAMRVR